MKMISIIAVAMLLPSAAIGASQKDVWHSCLDTGFDMKGCSLTELERLDPILKTSYRLALVRKPVNRDRLGAVQRAWGTFSQSECIYAFSTAGKGTLSDVFEKSCLVANTRRRIYELSPQGMQKLSGNNPTSGEFKKCSSAPTKSSTLKECLSAELGRRDKNLNTLYRKKLASANENDKSLGDLDVRERDSLIRAERNWIIFRDAQCGYLAGRQQEPDIQMTDLRCRVAMAVQRIGDLADGP